MLPTIGELCISITSKMGDVLRLISENAQGICFVLNEDGSFLGVITDGDIRRNFLKGETMESPITKFIKLDAVSLSIHSSEKEINNCLTEKIRHIPLLNEENKPVDYACYHRTHRLPVLEPKLGGNELKYITDCVTSGWISSIGSYVSRFESEIGSCCNSENVLAVSSGTSALHLALESLGVGEGDEVIVPDFTFAASINAVLYTKATPVLVDICEDHWTIDVNEIEKAITPKTKAIMPVHIYGHPCDMDKIYNIAQKHNLLVIEDSAEALGSLYKGVPVGSKSDASIFSFYGNKVITTGEGGAVIFKEKKNYEKAKILRDHGMRPGKRYWHDHIGYNYRMTNLQAAIGVAQLEQLPDFLKRRKKSASIYNELLKDVDSITPQTLEPWAESCNWLYTIILGKDLRIDRDVLMGKLLMNGIDTRPTFYSLHTMPVYSQYKGDRSFKISLNLSNRGISLPSSSMIEEKEIFTVVETIKSIIELEKFNRNVEL